MDKPGELSLDAKLPPVNWQAVAAQCYSDSALIKDLNKLTSDCSLPALDIGGAKDNLLTGKFAVEGNPTSPETIRAKSAVSVDTQTTSTDSSSMQINFKHQTAPDEPVTISQPINYQFKPTTALEKQFQKDHPNIDLGHIVHLHFRYKAENGGDMTLQIMGANSPYKQSLSERLDLGPNAGKKDAQGYYTYDGYAVVPDTADSKSLDLKMSFKGGQPQGSVDIKDLNLQEVDKAPGLDPAAVIKAYESSAAPQTESSFMLGANANHLIDTNTRVPDALLNTFVQTAQKDHPGDLADQKKEITADSAAYIKENSFTDQQKDAYLKELKAMGINTITIPVYWNQIEGQQGKPDYSSVDKLIEMAQKDGLKVKLHPLVWADTYPDWLKQGYDAAKAKDPGLSEDQYTQSEIHQHIDQTLQHFSDKFGGEIAAVEVNEMDSTGQLQHPKLDQYGRIIRGANGNPETEAVQNGLTQWIKDDGAAAVTNQVDSWIKQDLAQDKGLKSTQLFENEYYIDQKTGAFDAQINQSGSHPDAYGIEAHQFSSMHPDQNESDPLLEIAQNLDTRQPDGAKNYVSELTVETTAAPGFDESKMSPQVQRAEQQMAQYRAAHGEAPLTTDQRKAEEQQAEEMLAWYKLAENNPNTIGITLWDGSEKNAWLQNTGGVLDAQMQPKISYFAVQDYLNQPNSDDKQGH